ncbi:MULTISPECIES: restriction endonuclease subunit S [Shewanella]|uniref:restriction endonuclease subunit S n=1 Tax=Shewanella TaxID=22 RepID=UPI000C3F3C30|nr:MULTISPECIES: restriction endonuclease subunit S [Shewanella]NCQ43475.1 restriction endonuclease subunit S [Shewanella frigidimarina]NCO73515.1 restriction endonuclease subunit S [Shewanella vesiculosa]NCQ01548.1 restriction endonuclease subunit S [Shewanella vesiculosa]NCQ40185.1 restriction endonuclease subunit S [Shewanella vesiculosa]PIQ00733.1 MAG: restriction endonuclease subunit S [Shewanella sp. CG18_big_fil_WC_8_21_14_2_50_42_11]
MSHLSYMEKLLDGVEVEWKALGGLGELVRGNGLPKTDFTESGVPAIHYGQIYTFYGLSTESTKSYVSHETAKKLKKVNTGDVVITNTSENFADVGKALVYLGKVQAVTGGHATIFKPNNSIIGKYFAYFTQTNVFASEKRKLSKGTKVIDVSATDMAKILIPIPCPNNPEKSLAIQAEIVRILDAFTAMTAELTAELSLRKKQYNYYRDKLLSFEDDEVEWKTLGEVALDFGRGKSKHRPRNDPSLYGGDIPFIQTGDIRNAAHTIQEYSQTYSELGLKQSKLWPKGTLCITIAANIAETSILGFDACFPDSVIGFVANPEETSSSYVEYLLSSIKTQLEEKGQGSAQSNINLGTFQNLKLPFPPITEQERIVALLDKFELLTNSIIEGLPREIELRQKQYEYYRDLLLSFPKSHPDEAAK